MPSGSEPDIAWTGPVGSGLPVPPLQTLLPETTGLLAPASWRRMVRAVTFGLVSPGAAAAMQRERSLVTRVRTRQSGSRLIAFVAGKGGVGTTTTAIGVGLTLATLRTDDTVLVDARAGTGSLGRRLSDVPAPTTIDLGTGPNRPNPAANRRGLHVVDAPPWHSPIHRAQLVGLLEDLREEYPFTAVDAGNEASEPAYAALARADQVVIVTAASRDALDATRVALGRIQQVDPYRVPTAVIALVCTTARGYRPVARALRRDLGLEQYRIVVVPFDRGLVAGYRFDPDRLRPATREAYLRIAALLADRRQPSVPFLPPADV
jgi:MinD-like ATPase involved in chromosome partitioning or flagellar assembly